MSKCFCGNNKKDGAWICDECIKKEEEIIKGGIIIENLMSNKRVERIEVFWSSEIPKKYNRDQVIAFAKDDIEILLRERKEMEKILNLFNVIENHFNGEVK